MSVEVIQSKDQFNQLIEGGEKFFILKHSLTCPISAAAKQEFDSFSKESATRCYVLNIQEARELSNELAAKYEIKHESPQVLLINNNEVVFHDSHWNISKSKLAAAEA